MNTQIINKKDNWQEKMAVINWAIKQGKIIILNTSFGPKEVGNITEDFRVYCPKDNGGFGFHYHIANDGRFESLYKQACKVVTK